MTTMNSAAGKSSTVRRELTLHELVIPDLAQMDATGRFDRNVLLWLQDAYVSRAMKENTGELLNFHRDLARSSASEEERWQRKTEFLSKITKETYSAVRSQGGGFDLKQYVDAAKTFYESESVLYAGQLGELAQYIKQCLESGVKPDIERFAREAYVSMARMSGAITNLDGIGARANAQQVAQMMKGGIESINFTVVTQPGQSVQVGRELLKVVDQISNAPEKYMQFVDPYKLGSGKAGLWDFEPVHRDRGSSSALSM
jgi:hypothetical protein